MNSPLHHFCEACGILLVFPDPRGHILSIKRFCSKKCKNVASGQRRKQRELALKPGDGLPDSKVCLQCGKVIVRPPNYATNWWRKKTFCSLLCRQQFYREVNNERLRNYRQDYLKETKNLEAKRVHGREYARRQQAKNPGKCRTAKLANYYKHRERILAKKESERRAAGISSHGEAQSKPVKEIAEFYRVAFPDCTILLDHPVLMNPETGFPLRFDIWIPERRLAIEADGPIHRKPLFGQEKLEKTQRLDALKDRLAAEVGITLIRILVD